MEKVKTIDENLSIHDLRIVPGTSHTNLIFDCVMPHSRNMTPSELKSKIRNLVNQEYPNYYCVLTIDSSYAAMPHTHAD